MFVDSHAHLDGVQFDSDREQVIARAREAGVQAIVAIGNGDGPAQVDCGIRLAEKYDFIYATLGIHPHEARLADEAAYQNMERLARHPKVIAWGEIGLDYYYDHSPRDVQKEVFTRQMELAGGGKAADCDSLPSVGRKRRCVGRLPRTHALALGGQWAGRDSALLHGKLAAGEESARYGVHDFVRGQPDLSESATDSRCGSSKFHWSACLIETDSPYLAPVPHRGKRNEPAFVKETARKLGELRGLTPEELGQQTTRNFYNFFKLAETAESKVSSS